MNTGTSIAIGITFGVVIGLILSILTDQWWWMGIGVAIGGSFSAIIPAFKRGDSE